MSLELTVPANTMGGVSGDLTSRRGQLLGSRTLPNGDLSLQAQAPLGELNDLAGKLKSLTAGQGSYTLEFSHYQATPEALQKELASKWRRDN